MVNKLILYIQNIHNVKKKETRNAIHRQTHKHTHSGSHTKTKTQRNILLFNLNGNRDQQSCKKKILS